VDDVRRLVRSGAALAYAAAVLAGTWVDRVVISEPVRTLPTVLAGDFHVHAAPGDGLLPVWEIQREAARRGLDVVGITNHNHRLALDVARWTDRVAPYPIVIPGQELTTPRFHMAAIGVTELIDWRLPARDAIAAIHAQGGVAIVAHPTPSSYIEPDVEALRALDGAEVVHPLVLLDGRHERDLDAFFSRATKVNPDLAPIGSTDFHSGPLGICRTYLIVHEVSRDGVLNAIRAGRTVASGPGGRLVGRDDYVRVVLDYLRGPQHAGFGYGASTWLALAALLALAVVVVDTTGNAGPEGPAYVRDRRT
jgi:hypothetical protein